LGNRARHNSRSLSATGCVVAS